VKLPVAVTDGKEEMISLVNLYMIDRMPKISDLRLTYEVVREYYYVCSNIFSQDAHIIPCITS